MTQQEEHKAIRNIEIFIVKFMHNPSEVFTNNLLMLV